MFDWLGNIIGTVFANVAQNLAGTIWDAMLQWIYQTLYTSIGEFFQSMGQMGAELFDLTWVQAIVRLFTLLGWTLFAAGIAVAAFDVAVEYESGRASIKSCALNIIKGFFACSLIGPLPVELYRFCITLQGRFSADLAAIFAGEQHGGLAVLCSNILSNVFTAATDPTTGATGQIGALFLFELIAFAYCILKVFFANIKRGGILLIQIAVGSLYMFSVPRGYSDGFTQWVKQVIAICFTAFLQTTLLLLGLMTFQNNMVLGLGVMLSASEVPKIAQQFGMDTSAHVNLTSVMNTTSTAVNLARIAAGAAV